jgi:hypothetical protein
LEGFSIGTRRSITKLTRTLQMIQASSQLHKFSTTTNSSESRPLWWGHPLEIQEKSKNCVGVIDSQFRLPSWRSWEPLMDKCHWSFVLKRQRNLLYTKSMLQNRASGMRWTNRSWPLTFSPRESGASRRTAKNSSQSSRRSSKNFTGRSSDLCQIFLTP